MNVGTQNHVRGHGRMFAPSPEECELPSTAVSGPSQLRLSTCEHATGPAIRGGPPWLAPGHPVKQFISPRRAGTDCEFGRTFRQSTVMTTFIAGLRQWCGPHCPQTSRSTYHCPLPSKDHSDKPPNPSTRHLPIAGPFRRASVYQPLESRDSPPSLRTPHS
jgi:hypothetical protein